jgi:hypothetical protein
MAQVGCYLTDQEANDLTNYAQSLELARPSVCILLVQRELRNRRLGSLMRDHCPGRREGPLKRVTARIDNPALKAAFTEHVQRCGIGSDEGAAILFRVELEERWLMRTLGWQENRS